MTFLKQLFCRHHWLWRYDPVTSEKLGKYCDKCGNISPSVIKEILTSIAKGLFVICICIAALGLFFVILSALAGVFGLPIAHFTRVAAALILAYAIGSIKP